MLITEILYNKREVFRQMQDDDQKHKDQFDAALPLPVNDSSKKNDDSDDLDAKERSVRSENPAADLIRRRIEEAYAGAPDLKDEIEEAEGQEDSGRKLSKHQQFILDLTSSGKPLHEIQMAWHEYYAGLPDHEKNAVWQEFYKTQSEASHYHAATAPKESGASKKQTQPRLPSQLTKPATSKAGRQLQSMRDSFRPSEVGYGAKAKSYNPLHSVAFGLSVGAIVIFIFLFSFFNERFIAPFIQPSRNANNTPIISSTAPVGKDPEVIIPKINVEIPVVYTVNTIDENAVESALNDGVVHYADTALPGQDGNVVIVGHSSNNIFNPGKYKFAFVLLSRLENGDTFYLDKDGKRYTYEVYKKQIVSPTDVSVLGTTDKPATASLITCDPPGTSNNRLVVTGEQIDPSPVANAAQTSTNQLAQKTTIIPGNSPTLWSRFIHWFWS